jgi:lysophospholipase L1-like esterase
LLFDAHAVRNFMYFRLMRAVWLLSFRTLLVVVALAFAAGGCAPSPNIRPLGANAVVVAFGDSLTSGHGAGPGQDYPAVLAKLSGWQVVNAGIPGELSAAGLARLPGVLKEHRPALVLLCHGGNDILADNPADGIGRNLDAMIHLCREAGAGVVLLAVPQKSQPLKPAPVYAEVAGRNRVLLVEDAVTDVLKNFALKSDNVHPNAAGYARIAAEAWSVLRSAQR